jgi:hypothetical protein
MIAVISDQSKKRGDLARFCPGNSSGWRSLLEIFGCFFPVRPRSRPVIAAREVRGPIA